MADATRKTGIGIIGDVPWGTHFCHFYRAKEDLLNILVPYFQAGLENNEFCLWATAEPLGAKEARKAMEKAMPGFDRYLKTGQIEIVPHDRWYLKNGVFDSERVIRAWVDKLDRALAAGYSGMRASGNMSWLERKDWDSFADYEAAINRVIGQRQMVVLCAYWLNNISAADVFEVAGSHTFAVVGRNGDLELVEGALYRKKAEEVLRESEKKYRQLIETIHEGVWVVDKDAGTTFVNARMAEMLGYTVEEMMGKSLFSLVMNERGAEFGERKLESRRQGIKERYEVEAIRKDGTPIYVSVCASPILDDEGQYAGSIAGVHDITERKRTEEILKASEERFRALIENASDSIAILDNKGTILYESPSAEKVFGHEPRQLTGLSFPDLVHPDDAQRAVSTFASAMEYPGKIVDCQLRVKHKDGSWREVEGTAQNLLHDPKVEGIIVNYHDITERRKAEEALRTSEERYRLLVENATEGIAVIQDGEIVFANSLVTEVIGHSEAGHPPKSIAELIHPDDRQMVMERLPGMPGSQDRPSFFSFRIIDKEGNERWVEANMAPFTWDGRPAALAFVTDITERRKAEEALEQQNRLRAATNALAIELASLPSREITEAFVTKRLEEMTGASAVWFNEYDPSDRTLVLRHLEIETEVLEKVAQFLGKQPNEVRSPVSEDMYSEIVSSGIGRRETLTEVTFGAIPPSVSAAIQELMGVDHFIGIAYVTEGRLYGTSVLAMKAGRPDPARELLESVAHMVAISLRQRRAEDTLRQSEKKYRFMAENVADVIWTIDMNLRPTYLSPSITNMTGYSVQETMARGMEKGLTPAAIEAVSEIVMAEVARKGEPNSATRLTTVEVEMEHKDGSKIWAESAGTLLRGSDGQPVEIIGILRDITKRRQILAALERSEDRFRALVESGVDGILLVDSTGVILYGSPSMTAMLGYEEGSNDGRSMADFVHPDNLPEVVSLFGQLVANPGGMEHMELRVKLKSGSWKWTEVVGSNLLHDPAVEAIVLNLRDIHDRKKAQNALAESEKKHRQLVETIHDGIWAIDKDSNTTFVNPRMAEMLGYTIEEMTGKHLFAFMDERDVEVAEQYLERRQQGIKEQHEFEFLRKDGARIYASLETSSIIDDKGDYAGAIAGVQDITARKRAEEELQRQQKHFRALIENAADAVTIAGADGTISYQSPSCERMSGFKPEERIGTNIVERIHPDDLKLLSDTYSQLIRHPGSTTGDEIRLRHKDGTWLTVEATVTNLLHDPAVKGIVVNLHDITKRKQAEESLRESEERYRLLVENAYEMIVVVQDGKVVFANPKCAEVFGYTEEEMAARFFIEFIHPDNQGTVMEYYAKRLKGEHVPSAYSLRVIDKGGNAKWTEANTVLLTWKGRPAILGLVTDITERRRAEEDLLQSKALLNETERTGVIGGWAFDVETLTQTWTEETFRILEIDLTEGEPKVPEGIGFIAPEYRPMAEQAIQRAVEYGEPYDQEWEITTAKGNKKWVHSVARVHQEQGKTKSVVGSFQDITKRRQAEAALKKSHQLLNDTGEMAKVGGWELDLSTNEVSWTEEVGRIHGVGPGYRPKLEEALNFYAPESRSAVEAAVKKAAETGEPYDIEARLIPRGSKDKIWVRALGKAVYSGDEIVRLAGTFQNIDKYKRVEEALKANEDKFRGLFEHMTSGVAVYEAVDNGEDFVVKDFNPAANKINKVSREDVLGRRVTEAFPGIKESGLLDVFQRVWRTGKPEYSPEAIYRDEHNPGGWR